MRSIIYTFFSFLLLSFVAYSCDSIQDNLENRAAFTANNPEPVPEPELTPTQALAKDVENNIWINMKADTNNYSIEGFGLTHKGGNEYVGVLTLKEKKGEKQSYNYSIEVIYDGETFTHNMPY